MPSRAFKWTNPSVVKFSDGKSPIKKMEQVARDFVLSAMEKGWRGPPFDPVELAGLNGIKVRPNASISDARVLLVNDDYVIEYNPHRARGRVNYSLAHEIAHTFFSDWTQEVRNRGVQSVAANDWQLEMLCNIGAAEMLMPVGIFPTGSDSATSIEDLMVLRKKYQVSAEAVLIRYAKLASSPIACFAASKIPDSRLSKYRVDYCIGSQAWSQFEGALRRRTVISACLDECIAIGSTAKGRETWLEDYPDVHVEAVALPPYPRSNSLRIAGLVRPDTNIPTVDDLEYRHGNAAEFAPKFAAAIIHLVNDKAKSWGGFGFARELKRQFPSASHDYRTWAVGSPAEHRLGGFHVAELPENRYVVSLVAQSGYGPSARPRIRYAALDVGLEGASRRLNELGVVVVQMPRIGSGQAGGDWGLVAGLVRERLVSSGLKVRVLDPP